MRRLVKAAFDSVPLRLRSAALGIAKMMDSEIKVLSLEERWNLLSISDGELSLLVPSKSRIVLYRHGIRRRLNVLLTRYTLPGFCEIEQGDVVIDIGCHIGEFSMVASERCGQVVAIDGDPMAYSLAALNLSKRENVTVVHAVLAGTAKRLVYNLDPENADSSAFNRTSSSIQYSVKSKKLDDVLMDLPRIDYLKMDAEGFEPEVLDGSSGTLGRLGKVAIDCGPERGGKPTVDQVAGMLDALFEIRVRDYVVFGIAKRVDDEERYTR